MAKKILESQEAKEAVAKSLVGGQSQTVIAQTLGVSQSTISRLLKKEDVQGFIKEWSLKLLEAVPQSVENLKDLVNEMPGIPKGDIKRRELSYKASKKVLESAGLLNTPSPSPTFVNIFNQTTNIISPVMEKILAEIAGKSVDLPTEIDYGEDEPGKE